jgi:membrane carboxypeptidase/penicillin-binding protein
MSLPTDIMRARRRRARADKSRGLARIAPGLLVLFIIAVGTVALVVAMIYADLTSGVPPIQEIEHAFGSVGRESFQPVRIYDRSGEIMIFEAIHPAAVDRQWLRLDPLATDVFPQHVVRSSIIALDETFWTNPGYDSKTLLQAFTGSLIRRSDGITDQTIGQRLVETHLLSLNDNKLSPLAHTIRSALLAAELNRHYPKEQILEWYLNSAYYGHLAYGVDSAAIVYFGKHASELTLGESAILAAVPLQTELNPIDNIEQAREKQAEVLEEMVRQGVIRPVEADDALNQTLEIQGSDDPMEFNTSEFGAYVWDHLSEILQPTALHRSGLRVITTLDNDLQSQAACAARTHLKWLQGAEIGTVESTADGSACIAAGLLPPLRPSDTGVDHNVSDVAVIVLDPTTGQILSLVGPADAPRTPGSVFMPFIYLTAFARGYSPGTMVLDIPYTATILGDDAWVDVSLNDDGLFHGPVRMRNAVANSYNAAAEQTMNLVGVENIVSTARSMGINTLGDVGTDIDAEVAAGDLGVTLLDISFANGVIANQGRMVGMPVPSNEQQPNFRSLNPITILRVEDAVGRMVYTYEQEERAILSSQLAFLVADVLSDDTARVPAFGHPNLLEIGRPAGAKTGTTLGMQDNWTVGFTPSRVVGVRIGNHNGDRMQGVHALNGATPIWHAVIRYATRDLPQAGWDMPPGVSTLEVCDPSGLLPTQYCPNVVREVFVHGTEPTHYDNLYQPFLINKETGKLATLATPLDVVEERVYMIPPPEAAEWAHRARIEQPPQEYDTLLEETAFNPEINITSPVAFDVLSGRVVVRGDARPEGFEYYRLQFGQGLNPLRWIQIGVDESVPVTEGILGRWETEGLNGLYTLQLIVVQEDGRIATAVTHVTIDNLPPKIQLLSPEPGQEFTWPKDREVIFELEVSDEVSLTKVIFYVDERLVATVTASPYSTRWRIGRDGTYLVFAEAFDSAGNVAESEPVEIIVTR